jgi:hypothetical protein
LRRGNLQRIVSTFVLLVVAVAVSASDKTVTFQIPPVRIPLNVKDQRITLVASGVITLTAKKQGANIFDLRLHADLADLQQNLTAVLSEQLDKDDHCGDHIAIQNATLAPAEPAGQVRVQLHYERSACAKILGRQQAKRIVGGNAVIQMQLTPAVEENNTGLKLVGQVGTIQADGSLGELLRSGTLGGLLCEKIRKTILNALQKGTDLSATLPPAAQGYAQIKDARFTDAGSGRLAIALEGEIQITNDQIQALSKQVKERAGAK